MSRWTQYEEDACRLPEGFKRIAYDADTQRYTFRDRQGALYRSAPGESYGKLTPVSKLDGNGGESWRYDDGERPPLKISDSPVTSFHDILPPYAITSASSTSPVSLTSSEEEEKIPRSKSMSTSPTSSRSRFIEAARRSTMPKMQGVVDNLRRSTTSAKRGKHHNGRDSEKNDHGDQVGLLRSQSVMSRTSMVSTKSDMSMGIMAVGEKK